MSTPIAQSVVACLWGLAVGALVATTVTLGPALCVADELRPRESARVGEADQWSVGIFNPLTWTPSDGLELRTHPLLFALSPNLLARWAPWQTDEAWTVSVEGGLSLPWSAFSLGLPLGLKGYFSPTCAVRAAEPERADTCQDPGVFLVPRVGVAFSVGEEHVLTVRLDGAYGVALVGERVRPRDSYPYLDLLFAPVFNSYRVRAGVRYDHRVTDWLRVAAEGHVWRVGEGPEPVRDPWTASACLGADVAIGEGTRATLGVMYWNSDQRRVELVEDGEGFAHLERVRSHDFAPTLDIVWEWGG